MTIPLIEECLACALGSPVEYEYFHGATDAQIENLAEHCDARDEREFYVHRLNLHWFGSFGIGEIPFDY